MCSQKDIIAGMGRYPIFLNLAERRVVLIGAGRVAFRKAQSLLEAGARLVIVAEHFDKNFEIWSETSHAELIEAKYAKEYIGGASLVIAATNDHKLNRQVYKDCQELEVFCNVVDSPELCDFFVPAVLKRGDLQIAVSTDGNCPAYAGHVRKQLEKIFTEKHGDFLAELQKFRKRVIAEVNDPMHRKIILGRLVDDESMDYFIKNGPAEWYDRADEIIKESQEV